MRASGCTLYNGYGDSIFFRLQPIDFARLRKISGKRKIAVKSTILRHDLRSIAREASAAPAATLCAGHVQQLGGANPLPDLMEVKG
jgi:hypothetical protein